MHPRVTGSLSTAEKESGQAMALRKGDVNPAILEKECDKERIHLPFYCNLSSDRNIHRIRQRRYPDQHLFWLASNPWLLESRLIALINLNLLIWHFIRDIVVNVFLRRGGIIPLLYVLQVDGGFQ